jgi:tRNA(fMet)-specific endonuclease VapC
VRTFRVRAWIDPARYQCPDSLSQRDARIAAAIRGTSRTELALPSIVLYELEYGTLRSGMPERRRRQLELGLVSVQRIPFDTDAATAAARIRVGLEKRGLTIGPLDVLIGGTALSRGATLVTNNAAEFSRIEGLHVTDWSSGEALS